MANQGDHGRFSWNELMTSNTDAAKKFYSEVVGWTTKDWGDGAMDYTLFSNGDIPVAGLMKIPPEAAAMGAPPSWSAYVEVSDVDATIEQATKLGASMLGPAQSVQGVGRFAMMRDPQGIAFAIVTSENPLSPEGDPQAFEFSWHELSTTDAAAAFAFYNALFGWEKTGEFDMGPMGVYQMYGRGRFIYGGMMNATPGAPHHWLHYARVPDSADAAAERAGKAGGTVILPPMDVPGGDRVAVVIDPQGAGFGIHFKAAVPATPAMDSASRPATLP
ncbi:MAG TPA: VOC family protein [Gemmatimonadaceae bacterium]|nr:VOC family protein [Gemmatimonadaceae bacterium]